MSVKPVRSLESDMVEQLVARLPELSWMLHRLHGEWDASALPPALFQRACVATPSACMDDIHADLRALKQQTNPQSVHFLAERVARKITVLVQICKKNLAKPVQQLHASFGVQSISTRQKWLQTMHDDIAVLICQQQALLATLLRVQQENKSQAILNVQLELGQVEQRLTLAKESLQRATAF
jgi:hypothetical protein